MPGRRKRSIFVIHEHHATRLHWDLRLEMEGVLKSWAVTKRPVKAVGVKRLAVATDDHPLEYAKFKGTIPEGYYGAGKVEIWDKGTYELEDRKPNKLVFVLKGKRLKGRYVLVKFKTREGKPAWLFFKAKGEKKKA